MTKKHDNTSRAHGRQLFHYFFEVIFEAQTCLKKTVAGDSQAFMDAARTLHEDNLLLFRGLDAEVFIAPYLEAVAGVMVTQSLETTSFVCMEAVRAARLWGATEALRETIGTCLSSEERATYERLVATTRLHLGEETFAVAWAQGRSMTPEQALAALKPATRPEQVLVGR